jgi:hypothetical protein
MFSGEQAICLAASQRAVGDLLQEAYGAVVNEPLPERLLELLKRLDAPVSTACDAGRPSPY